MSEKKPVRNPRTNPYRLLTLSEVAEATGMRFDQIKELVRRGAIVSVRCGEDYRVPPQAILAFYEDLINGRAREPGSAPRPIGSKRRPAA
jgi:excisionase family DNA binding protein